MLGKQIMIVDDMEVDITYIKNASRFGVSLFSIGLTHADAPLLYQLKLHKALREIKENEKDR